MRASRKLTIHEVPINRNELSNPTNPAEDLETGSSSKPLTKKNPTPISLSDGLPMHITIEQLKSILTQPANNIADRAVLLDARDRLVRLRKDAKDKYLGDQKVSTLKGTCLDMCPEKERYSRAEKHRLASYEMLITPEKDYEVDHRLAIKEYSRSSADQAEPLAHELRPLSVLQMTMDYLIAKIIDRCDRPGEHLGDWFNFLWDRMRGIRKDITQQSLCEQGSVDLVEKCARFHIHCTSRLCELDMQDFDQKINDENLTKCLQTLKHMYYDLSVKNIFCPNEAEFRSYDVILHLNDGEILREVLQLRAEVRDSPEVRSALEFVNTLNSRNYVRFFKLAKLNQDYLQCCLLQRYFNQMRNQALQIMVQAYGPPKKGQMLLSSLVKLLGFEDEEEAAVWCECHGLPFDKKAVKFDRTSLIELPEKFPPMRRSSLIESKRISSVSKFIARGLVPEDPTLHHTPLSSFDCNGLLLKEAWLAEEQQSETKNIPPTIVHQSVIKLPTNVSVSMNLVESISLRVRNNIINTIVEETLTNIAQQILAQKFVLKITSSIFENYFEEFTQDFCKEIINEAISEFFTVKRHQEQHKLDVQRKLHVWSNQIFREAVDSFLNDQVKLFAIEAIQSAAHLRATILKDNYAQRMLELLVNEITTIESRAVASAVAYEAIETRESMVLRVSELVTEHRVRRWIGKWRRFTELQIRRRKEKQTFPACPSRMIFEQQIFSLKSKGESAVAPLKRKSLLQQNVCVKRFNSLSDLQFNLMKISSSVEEKVFDLFALIEQSLKNNFGKDQNRSWKLVILAVGEDKVGEIFRKWFGYSSAKQSLDGWVYIETRTTQNPFTLCVRFINDFDRLAEFLNGANAILVVYNPLSEVESTLQSLIQMVRIHSKYFPLPVASIASQAHSQASQNVLRILQPCSHFTLNFDKPSFDKHSKLVELFSTLMQAGQLSVLPSSTRLCTTNLWDLANNFVSHKILPTVYRDMQQRLECGLSHQPLSRLLNFSNRAVQHLIEDIVSDSELSQIRWPAPELVEISYLNFPPVNWNSKEYQAKLKYVFERYLILPVWQSDEKSFSSISTELRNYCDDILIQGADATAFFSRIDSILLQSKLRSEGCSKQNVLLKHNVPWTDIFQACIDYRLQAFIGEGSFMITGYFIRSFDEINVSWIEARSILDASDEPCFEMLDTQPYDRGANESNFNQQKLKSLEVPYNIATLCDAINDTSKQSREENHRFEAILLGVPTSEKKSRKYSPVKNSPAPGVSIADRIDFLEKTLHQTRCESQQFESYLKHMLNDA